MKKTKQDLKPASGRSDGAGTDRVRASNAGAAADETGSAAVSTESASSDTAASGEDYQRRCDQYHRQSQSPFC